MWIWMQTKKLATVHKAGSLANFLLEILWNDLISFDWISSFLREKLLIQKYSKIGQAKWAEFAYFPLIEQKGYY